MQNNKTIQKNTENKWVSYIRVSTQRQGVSGLGMASQQQMVTDFLSHRGGELLGEFVEIESGKKSNRPELLEAMTLCKRQKATLVIAKLDRLARNVHFISGLMESGVDFVAVDMPTKDRFMLHVQAAFAEEESRIIGVRTKAALAQAKLRGVDIGATGRELAKRHKATALKKAKIYAPVIKEIRGAGFTTVKAVRDELNRRQVVSPGGASWHLPSTHRLLKRLETLGLV